MALNAAGLVDGSPSVGGTDRSWELLELAQRWLLPGPKRPLTPLALLEELIQATGAVAAGLLDTATGTNLASVGEACPSPWANDPAVGLPAEMANEHGYWLLLSPAARPGWLVWLRRAHGEFSGGWPPQEQAAIRVVLQVWPAPQVEDRDSWRALAVAQRLELAATMTGRLAHDFGNALTGMLGFTELALRELDKTSLPYRYLREAYQAGERATQWICKLRLFARRKPINQTPCELPIVLDAVVARNRAKWGPSLRLEVSAPTQLPALPVDQGALLEALQQLLDNAREAIGLAEDAPRSHQSLVAISVRTTELSAATAAGLTGGPPPGTYVELRISDNGSGMTEELRGRLFRDLFCSTKPHKRGLGLLMVYGVIRSCGGGLHIDSSPGVGTAVRLYLPCPVEK